MSGEQNVAFEDLFNLDTSSDTGNYDALFDDKSNTSMTSDPSKLPSFEGDDILGLPMDGNDAMFGDNGIDPDDFFN